MQALWEKLRVAIITDSCLSWSQSYFGPGEWQAQHKSDKHSGNLTQSRKSQDELHIQDMSASLWSIHAETMINLIGLIK